MKTYFFTVSDYPDSTFHQPLNASLVLSENSVLSGMATASDVLSLEITAGTALPGSRPITFEDLLSQFLNPTITLSADRESIVAFSAERDDGFKYDFWAFYKGYQQSQPVKKQTNIELRPNKIRIETNFITLPSEHYASEFLGGWNKLVKIPHSVHHRDLSEIHSLVWGSAGIWFGPGTRPVPIDPEGRLWRNLSPHKRDIALGLAVSEIAASMHDQTAGQELERLALEAVRKAVNRLIVE